MKFAPFAHLATAAALTFAAIGIAHAYDPKATIADLDARLSKIGAPKIDGTEEVVGKKVPAIFFGDRKINNNYDVVDAVRKAHNATATVFVKDGDEFVRVSTNVLTPEGKRGVGTQLARNAAYEAVSKGQQFCGPIDVLGTAFDACYNPIKDGGGKVIGVSYIGHKK
jgi:Cache 3/Cache 2 fusion domain